MRAEARRQGRHLVTASVALLLSLTCAPSPGPLAGEAGGAFGATTTEIARTPPDRTGAFSEAFAAEVIGDRAQTLFQLTMTKGVPAEISALSKPYRIIIDLPDVTFALPAGTGQTGRGLVTAYRYGQFAERKARIVIDTVGPVRIGKAAMTNTRDGSGVILTLELIPTDKASFAANEAAQPPPPGATETAATPDPVGPDKSAALGKPPQNGASTRPIILIDPGHGGIDPGAVGAGDIKEKDIVLAVARKLQKKLEASGRYDVRMTRAKDVFVSLDERLKMSRSAGSSLFISLHADSIEQTEFQEQVAGATVYTLSERASDAAARAKAEKENASDLIAGLKVASADENEDVMNILFDLAKRETSNFSVDFSRTLVGQMRRNVSLSRKPQKSAAFKVLKQVNTPSVLIELGYITNPGEAEMMSSSGFHDRVSRAIAAAVDEFFAKRPTASAKP